MIEGTFDAPTLARMNLALESVCQTVVGGEAHSVRKRVARRIIKCARSGKTSVEELTSAGQRAVMRFARSDSAALSGDEGRLAS
jgi:predicted MarR family transcription regulator